jgi:NADPH:quinone reductase-like Zn-dependent oxidoreductase
LVLNHQRVHTMIQRHLENVARGALHVVVDRTFPLAEAAAAHAFIESGARPAFATATNAVHASFFDVARMRRVAATILAVAIAW